ncbi:hypothetical protein BDK51DRAFT_42137 [Blyttiomyces helicus]|uniref:Uncharacterized protein n=1 Tax=Blyttiomyces helicus TaxID=388810 RepID=A0A4P9WS23_9FUNG|nr:hypothetical protein BDK51DRAFT_42137 [Blyttiomyces helicus]|eukprot:RKO93766.1 hypothetical protein BDK51DRAFT_42137 [Blyttiomyces helicus]
MIIKYQQRAPHKIVPTWEMLHRPLGEKIPLPVALGSVGFRRQSTKRSNGENIWSLTVNFPAEGMLWWGLGRGEGLVIGRGYKTTGRGAGPPQALASFLLASNSSDTNPLLRAPSGSPRPDPDDFKPSSSAPLPVTLRNWQFAIRRNHHRSVRRARYLDPLGVSRHPFAVTPLFQPHWRLRLHDPRRTASPTGRTMALALIRQKAMASPRLGEVPVDPGGPGGSESSATAGIPARKGTVCTAEDSMLYPAPLVEANGRERIGRL